MSKGEMYPRFQAIIAALLFGASAPLAKLLLGDIQPIMLAALLYLGCGAGLLTLRLFQNFATKPGSREAGLTRVDLPWLAGAIIAGGVAAPIILMLSLRNTPAATASLLLNFEGVATSLIALLAFKEALGKRLWAAIELITLASIILTWDASGASRLSLGAAGVLLACIFWGLDNNFTRNISAKDPLSIVTVKGLVAGSVSLCISLATGGVFPHSSAVLSAMVLGFFSYGISIMLFILAMRSLGAARASGFFSSAPFIGALISVLLLREWPGISFLISLPIMVVGTVLILGEDHMHLHRHKMFEHEHRHSHDDGHHNHAHDKGEFEEHSHWHTHEELEHQHPHMPDIHHRHAH
jgi:drug/metabolite transporter (DMT)-like permease